MKYNTSNPTLVNLTSNFLVQFTNMQVYLYIPDKKETHQYDFPIKISL